MVCFEQKDLNEQSIGNCKIKILGINIWERILWTNSLGSLWELSLK